MLQQQISTNVQFQVVLKHSYLQEYLKFYTDCIHIKHYFSEVSQTQKVLAYFPLSFKGNIK